MFGEVEQRLGRLDGLVNNAARFTRFDPLEITEKDWDFIHSVNLKAVFFCCQQAALPDEADGRRAHRQFQFAGRHSAVGGACALLRVEGGVIMLTRALSKAFAPGDHGELGGAGSDSVRRHR